METVRAVGEKAGCRIPGQALTGDFWPMTASSNAAMRIYLDHNASAPLGDDARRAMIDALALCGNASSVHGEGRRAREIIERSRAQVAALFGVAASRVTFTSGGTEAANLALRPGHFPGGALLLAGAGEHACVLEGHGFGADNMSRVQLDPQGRLDLADLERQLFAAGHRACVLALQVANNETGVIQPLAQAAALVRAHGGVVVGDAVQAAGKLDCSKIALDADMAFVSAHKIGGPQGAGAVVLLNTALTLADPLLRGGGQERGVRAGTENVAAIAGFGAAARACLEAREIEQARLAALRDGFETGLRRSFADVRIFGAGAPRLANTSAFAISGCSAETVLIGMDLEGVAVSSGSACSSGKVKSSHVLDAMGVEPNLAGCAIRVSFGSGNAAGDAALALAALLRVTARMREKSTAKSGRSKMASAA